jgi:diacylglycerol kinase (ATP)
MKIALMYNTLAGQGRAGEAAEVVRGRLAADGHAVEPIDTSHNGRLGEVSEAASRSDVLVALGGDGTVQAASIAVEASATPIYHFPLGTENLFAREWEMSRRYETLRASLDAWRVEPVDAARCNGVRFLLMCSVGPDANVVHRLASVRSGAITHMSYAQHVMQEFLNPSFPTLTVEADGETVVDGRAGLLVIANSRQYALRLDPARDAVMTDGLLDVVFFPMSSRAAMLRWLTAARLRRRGASSGVSIRARRVRARGEHGPLLCQLDGEAGFLGADDPLPAGGGELEVEVEPRALRVLAPPRVA